MLLNFTVFLIKAKMVGKTIICRKSHGIPDWLLYRSLLLYLLLSWSQVDLSWLKFHTVFLLSNTNGESKHKGSYIKLIVESMPGFVKDKYIYVYYISTSIPYWFLSLFQWILQSDLRVWFLPLWYWQQYIFLLVVNLFGYIGSLFIALTYFWLQAFHTAQIYKLKSHSRWSFIWGSMQLLVHSSSLCLM